MRNYYFIGIGGIGMSALARFLHRKGHAVCGYDKTPSPVTDKLSTEGIQVFFEESPVQIPENFRNPKHTTVVVTPAVPADHQGLKWFGEQGFECIKRAALLGNITRNYRCLCVAGTHGKTTTSSMLASLMHQARLPIIAFLGGISNNLNSNFYSDESPEFAIVEADEFDRSFLHLHPSMAILTSMEPDHLDIYGSPENVAEAYQAFANRIDPNGLLLHKAGLKISACGEAWSYGIESGDIHASNLIHMPEGIAFDWYVHGENFGTCFLPMQGLHNVENAIAALTLAWACGAERDVLKEALKNFKGVGRRMECKAENENVVYYDDYAHHPTEIRAAILAARKAYPEREITVLFQPHLFSRTRDFADEFALSLSEADHVYLLDIYPAREKPIPGITSQWLLEKIQGPQTRIMTDRKQFLDQILPEINGVLLTLGAGDIDRLVQPVSERIKNPVMP